MDFLRNQHILYSSKKYENIYTMFKDKFNISYAQLFILCATTGFKNNRKSNVEEKSREFRTNYMNTHERSSAYAIILGDQRLGKRITDFEDAIFVTEAKKLLEEYAEGGMDVIIENVFKRKWDGVKLDESYIEYDIDLISYVYGQAKVIPF
ncbi:hypothetical protein [Paraclostridium sordellii]|uniref:hypothetical protein n=1 Tax=Paraclostridium sordellii TaxID=1505 RepID=UPI0005E3A3D1|nr:hypothetical protein [Paeniclostridium sordellii]CEN87588.1 Uncharacterised protein [[Clostridium] sordellii] [Paeniclostridium sordellii]